MAVSALVAGELWHGVAISQSRARSEAALNQFLANLQILEWPARAARIYGELRAALERAGRVIGAMDMLIAAHARHEDATLITHDLAEFNRVEGLRVDSWIDR